MKLNKTFQSRNNSFSTGGAKGSKPKRKKVTIIKKLRRRDGSVETFRKDIYGMTVGEVT